MNRKIHYVKPSIGDLELSYAAEAVRYGWGDNSYKFVEDFQERFATITGATYALATSSCTGAIELALAALNIGPGDEVILGDTNWIATVAPVVHRGATPVFVDILEDSWCLNPDRVIEEISGKTKAIIATHLYGNLCDMKELVEISKKYGIPIIEDAAEALGSRFHGKHAGTIGEIGVFSFHGSKTITTGEGGMLVTNSQEIADRLSQLNNHGRSPKESRQFFPAEIGYKFKMSNLQAAIGLAQLERFDELISRKQQILNSYRDALSNSPEISINPIQDNCVSGSWMPNVVFSESTSVTREKLVAIFRQANIDARVFFWPVSSLGLVKSRKTHTPIAYSIASRSINLPSYHDIGDDDIARVVELLLTTLN